MIFFKKNIHFTCVIAFCLFVNGHTLNAQTITTSLVATVRDKTNIDIGFNRRSDNGTWWTDTSFQTLLAEMNPDVLRYPGGTQANYWDWRTGQFLENTDKSWGGKEVLQIPDFVNAVPSRTKIIYVVNMARPTPNTGVAVDTSEAVLKSDATLNLKIADMISAIDEFVANGKEPYAIELGNEFYFGNTESGIYEIIEVVANTEYTSGWDEINNQPYTSSSKKNATVITAQFYLKHCKAIVSAIKAAYPNMKFALTTTKEESNAAARERWNTTLFNELENNPDFATLKSDIYAVTQHHYLNDSYGVQTVITDNASAELAIAEGIQYPKDKQSDYDLVPNDYKIWYTEYGEVKAIADETWASAVRYAALVYSWMSMGDKVGQLDYHYVSDHNVVKVGNPMVLAPIGIAAKLVSKATADMTQMQDIIFTNNPISVNDVNALYGYKFKNNDKETILIINTTDSDISQVPFSNLITYTGQPTLTKYFSTAPYVSGVFEGDSNITSVTGNINNSTYVNKFSITVIEVPNETLNLENFSVEKIKVYPNPLKNKLNIEATDSINKISIWSLYGKLIVESAKLSNNSINLEKLDTGIYILNIETNNGTFYRKIIKYQ